MHDYKTKQREQLINFLSKNPDKAFSAQQILDALCDSSISQSSIYRNLVSLEEKNVLRRIFKENSREAHFQFIDNDECKNAIHVMCSNCGETFHIKPDVAKYVESEVSSGNNFHVDRTKTIIYGECESCWKKNHENK